jgi:signal transduction histidine kinase
VAEEDRRQINHYFRKILKGELPLAKGLEYRQLNRKGEDHLISLTIYPDMNELGQISGIEGVGVDITEKKRLEAELEKARELALLGEFSSAVAHQIRNPLGKKRYDIDLPSLSLDAVLMSQVFQNVIYNAIQSMPNGGRLTVSCERSHQIAGYSSIQISDGGGGIKASEMDKIFRPFFTSKESGTGLGLSLAYRIVEAHQGSIWASNNLAQGATINILLPLDRSYAVRNS